MYDVLRGIRVVEVSMFAFVPAAGTALADWGADVVKVVHPVTSDPMATAAAGNLEPLDDGTAFMWELANRGKRSIGLDLNNPDALEILYDLVREADVFLTSFLPAARRKLKIEFEDIKKINPKIVYGRGSAVGIRGEERETGGYDTLCYWGRSGMAYNVADTIGYFISQPGPGFGDLPSGFMLASGVVGALLRRERTGEGGVVDVSLLGSGMWANSPGIMASELYDIPSIPIRRRADNPLFGGYRAQDGRYIFFAALISDGVWSDFCAHVDRPDLVDDPRFCGHRERVANNLALVDIIDEIVASQPLDYWVEHMKTLKCPWSTVQTSQEAMSDPQALANGYVVPVVTRSGRSVHTVATPVQFDEQALSPTEAPEPGQHTEEILLELGRDWDEIIRLKSTNAIM